MPGCSNRTRKAAPCTTACNTNACAARCARLRTPSKIAVPRVLAVAPRANAKHQRILTMTTINPDSVRDHVREGYGRIARDTPDTSSCCGNSGGGGCCGPAALGPDQLAAAIGYSEAELANTPDGANMGLSCGNPTAIASLKPGEVVLDLG